MSGLSAGLCSVTFRDRTPEDIVELASAAGLDCIEWGGDVHAPHGEVVAAQRVAELTHEAGMSVCSYGSYLFADHAARDTTEAVLDTTEALDAPAVRVWAPLGVEPGCNRQQFAQVADSLGEITAAADQRGLLVYVEFHGGTLTATAGVRWCTAGPGRSRQPVVRMAAALLEAATDRAGGSGSGPVGTAPWAPACVFVAHRRHAGTTRCTRRAVAGEARGSVWVTCRQGFETRRVVGVRGR